MTPRRGVAVFPSSRVVVTSLSNIPRLTVIGNYLDSGISN